MKLNFQYSQVYDELLTYMSRNHFDTSQVIELEIFTIKLAKYWQNIHDKIVKEIEKISGLKFNNNVDCFIVKHLGYRAISEPFTIKMNKDFNYLTAILVHELVHHLIKDNSKILKLVNTKFAHEENDFKIHFPVLLVERKVIENLFGDKFFKNIMKKDDHNPDLAYEWEEVNRVYPHFKANIIGFLEKC